MEKKTFKIFISAIAAVCVFAALIFCVSCVKPTKHIGVAWSDEDATGNILLGFEKSETNVAAEVMPLVKYDGFQYNDEGKVTGDCLDQYGMLTFDAAAKLKAKPYDHTNVEEVVSKYDAIVFPGGEDVAPSLYKNPQAYYDYSEDPGFNATRDVSDYILMSYCLDHDIKIMAICRGMQLYAITAGAEMIQDLPTYYASKGIDYNNEHRKSGEINGKAVRGNHPVYVTDKDSYVYDWVQSDVIEKPFSSHHQAVLSVDPSKTKVTAVGRVGNLETIEALQRTDSDAFNLIVQFHPEHALGRWVKNQADKESFMSEDTCLSFFKYFVAHI